MLISTISDTIVSGILRRLSMNANYPRHKVGFFYFAKKYKKV
nr:MAG TPA: hypothetical protein [Caudoviricetes sp.]